MQNIGGGKILAELLDTLINGCKRVVGTTLDLNRGDVMTGCDNFFLNKEVYLHPTISIFPIGAKIEEKIVA